MGWGGGRRYKQPSNFNLWLRFTRWFNASHIFYSIAALLLLATNGQWWLTKNSHTSKVSLIIANNLVLWQWWGFSDFLGDTKDPSMELIWQDKNETCKNEWIVDWTWTCQYLIGVDKAANCYRGDCYPTGKVCLLQSNNSSTIALMMDYVKQ